MVDTSSMVLEYYLLEEKDRKSRGRQEMKELSFDFSSGEVYKVRAAQARERQMWEFKLGASTSMFMVETGSDRKLRMKTY